MHVLQRHLTDSDLLRRLDDELSDSRRAAVDRHLLECETCRARRAAIEETASAAWFEYRTIGPDLVSVEQSRTRLKAGLNRAAGNVGGSWSAVSEVLMGSMRAIAAVAMVVVAGLAAWAFNQAKPATGRLSIGADLMPVTSITPGATWDVTADELCAGTRLTRPITEAMRTQVVSAYGVERVPIDQYELDYLITPELGGATDARNLWPQGYSSPIWNARVKDELERLLPQLVCSRRLNLATAQRDMAVDWIAAYKKYFKTDVPLEAHRGPAVDDDEGNVYLLAEASPVPAIRLVSFTAMR